MSPESVLLDLWERAAGVPPTLRDDALLHGVASVPQGLGERNAALLALRERLFGPRWPLRSTCPACGAVCEFQVDCRQLVPAVGAGQAAAVHAIEVDGREIRFRLPRADDLREAARAADVPAVARRLLQRCVLDGDVEALTAAAMEALSTRMEALDPGARIVFALACPECGAPWEAPVDVGDALWREVRTSAERTLLDVDALARAYGWSEAEVLSLGPTRRAAYLQLVGAA